MLLSKGESDVLIVDQAGPELPKRRPTGVDLKKTAQTGGFELLGGGGSAPVSAAVRNAELLPGYQTLEDQAIGLEAWETALWAGQRILDEEPVLGPVILDPCCGTGILSRIARQRGHKVIALDIARWGFKDQDLQADFLTWRQADWQQAGLCADTGFTVLMNPPFQLAVLFILKAMAMGATKIICFQRWAFLESSERRAFWEQNPPSKPWLCGDRADCHLFTTLPEDRGGRSMANGWFIWEPGRPPEPMGILYRERHPGQQLTFV
jgi:hypothetical protein